MSRLGVFDSGLGGYDILQQIQKKYPEQDLIFLADQKNVSYGNKSRAELENIFNENMTFFKKKRVKRVLVACNTMSALELEYPGIELYRIIETTASKVEEEKVIVLATKFTVENHAYKKYLTEKEVIEIALPNMARLIESGASEEEILEEIDSHCSEYKDSGISVVCGCTHFPLVKEQIYSYFGGKIYESGEAVLGLPIYSQGKGKIDVYTSGDPEEFAQKVYNIYGEEIVSHHAR